MHECFHCGGELIWDADFTFEDFGYDEEGLVHVLHCDSCGGAEVTYWIPRKEEEDDDDSL